MTGMMWVELKRELEINGEDTSQQKKMDFQKRKDVLKFVISNLQV